MDTESENRDVKAYAHFMVSPQCDVDLYLHRHYRFIDFRKSIYVAVT